MTPTDFRAWRKRLSLTQEEAAAALGISTSMISNYEAGEIRSTDHPAPIPKTVALACAAVARGLREP